MLLSDIPSYFLTDAAFDNLYPVYIKRLSLLHFTPLNVAATAAQFLAPNASSRVLDIGAGAGKFCIAGSYFSPGHFAGIEQRKNFVQCGNKLIRQLGLANAELVHGNFTSLDLSAYSGIYFYNSFHENIVLDDSLDEKIERSGELYDKYTAHLLRQLKAMPIGARLATYWLSITEIPGCYKLYESHYNNLLKLWIKEY